MDNNLLKDKKILILEDEADVLNSLKILFESEGAKVIHSDYASKAIPLAEKESPDLCIFDVMLPDESGIQVFVEFRNHPFLYSTPIIFVSGINSFELGNIWTASSISERYQVPPPEGFFDKPFNPNDLFAKCL
ncbi:MAG TPA: response regulator [Candidatus Hydrogenedens sp.]|nr:response regulator [Candidatus Hydrogenedens sp.]